jgi:hypothetical protein
MARYCCCLKEDGRIDEQAYIECDMGGGQCVGCGEVYCVCSLLSWGKDGAWVCPICLGVWLNLQRALGARITGQEVNGDLDP